MNRNRTEESLPNALPGIDIKDGLNRLMGNRALYIRLMGTFFKTGYLDAIKKAVDEGERAKARELSHAVKGAAANLGLAEISGAAARLFGFFDGKNKGALDGLMRELEESYETARNSFSVLGEFFKNLGY